MENSGDPTADELAIITHLGRLDRLIAAGMTPAAAAELLHRDETSDEYAERNRAAMAALEARLLSPEYEAKIAAIEAIKDPAAKAKASAALKRENFALIDMEAVHRTIRARNRQFVAEGILPPHAQG